MNIYPKSNQKELSLDLFRNPTNEYRGAPFWAWNTKLEKKVIEEQLPIFARMGFGGYHLHPRTGLDTAYLSDAFMDMVGLCADYAKTHEMKCYCYDEDRFPSGAAGGLVTADVKFRQRQLVWTKNYDDKIEKRSDGERVSADYFLGKYIIKQNEDGTIASYHKIENDEPAEDQNVRYAFVRIAKSDPWFNYQSYVDTMYKPAIDEFIKVTHSHYYDTLGEYFGETIPSFFTDEPKVVYKKMLSDPWDEGDVIMPWTDDFPETFFNNYNFDIIEHIPELFLELPDGEYSKARYFYHRHVLERFCEGFSKNIGVWCDVHGVALAGHMVKENKLSSQSTSAGEVMAPLSAFGIPGIDMLCDAREYTTAKQTQSVKDQYGKQAMLSELYGVTNWDFDFRGHKLAGDWQAALGVTLRVPHLAWMSMKGEAKRDYPASIFYQSPWYNKYRIIEDHFARVGTAMTRGKRIVKIALIHPVESSWLYWGVKSETKETLKRMDDRFKAVTADLLFAQLDFDFISETLLPEQYKGVSADKELLIGEMHYRVVVLPYCESLRSTTKDVLDQFTASGGRVILLGNKPAVSDGEPVLQQEFNGFEYAENEEALLDSLNCYRDFEIRDADGSLSDQFLIQHRREEKQDWFFIANGRKDTSERAEYSVLLWIKSNGIPYIYDTMKGTIRKAEYLEEDGVKMQLTLHKHDSLLLSLREEPMPDDMQANRRLGSAALETDEACTEEKLLPVADKVPVSLSEANCLVLDECEYYIDANKNELYEKEEILRIGDRLKNALGIASEGGRCAQPWTIEKEACRHRVTLKFIIKSRVNVFNACLALEDASEADICLNGKSVVNEISGYYVDKAIEKVMLPPIRAGENHLEVSLPFGKDRTPEACYLLGDFSVFKEADGYVLDVPVKELAFDDIVGQGLPFYGGNITYYLYYEAEDCDTIIQTEKYKGALISVEADGEYRGEIIFDPYEFELTNMPKGRHVIGLTLYGNRVNTFGTLHNALMPLKWVGPEAFRPSTCFTYDYVLRETGILEKPILKSMKRRQKNEQ